MYMSGLNLYQPIFIFVSFFYWIYLQLCVCVYLYLRLVSLYTGWKIGWGTFCSGRAPSTFSYIKMRTCCSTVCHLPPRKWIREKIQKKYKKIKSVKTGWSSIERNSWPYLPSITRRWNTASNLYVVSTRKYTLRPQSFMPEISTHTHTVKSILPQAAGAFAERRNHVSSHPCYT
jgi:hypothetical protein